MFYCHQYVVNAALADNLATHIGFHLDTVKVLDDRCALANGETCKRTVSFHDAIMAPESRGK